MKSKYSNYYYKSLIFLIILLYNNINYSQNKEYIFNDINSNDKTVDIILSFDSNNIIILSDSYIINYANQSKLIITDNNGVFENSIHLGDSYIDIPVRIIKNYADSTYIVVTYTEINSIYTPKFWVLDREFNIIDYKIIETDNWLILEDAILKNNKLYYSGKKIDFNNKSSFIAYYDLDNGNTKIIDLGNNSEIKCFDNWKLDSLILINNTTDSNNGINIIIIDNELNNSHIISKFDSGTTINDLKIDSNFNIYLCGYIIDQNFYDKDNVVYKLNSKFEILNTIIIYDYTSDDTTHQNDDFYESMIEYNGHLVVVGNRTYSNDDISNFHYMICDTNLNIEYKFIKFLSINYQSFTNIISNKYNKIVILGYDDLTYNTMNAYMLILDSLFTIPYGYSSSITNTNYNTNYLLNNFHINNTSEINIYPNPINDYLNIKTNLDDYNVNIYNINGLKVKSFNKNNYIDMKNLQSGSYFIEILSKNIKFVNIIQKL